jgi:small basic protein
VTLPLSIGVALHVFTFVGGWRVLLPLLLAPPLFLVQFVFVVVLAFLLFFLIPLGVLRLAGFVAEQFTRGQ